MTRYASPVVAQQLGMLKYYIKLPLEKARDKIKKLGLDYDDGSLGISAFATSTILWSFYAFLKSRNDFVNAQSICILGGGACPG